MQVDSSVPCLRKLTIVQTLPRGGARILQTFVDLALPPQVLSGVNHNYFGGIYWTGAVESRIEQGE